MDLRDRNGLNEQEFLAQYKPGDYPRPSVTVDIVLLSRRQQGLRVLLVRRGGHPYLHCWALPGGFVDANETVAAAAARELEEEVGLRGIALYPVGLFSDPGRDPRTWVMSQAYAALVDEAALLPVAGDDAVQAGWFDVTLLRDGTAAHLRLKNGDGTMLTAHLSGHDSPTPFGSVHQFSIIAQEGLAFDHAKILCTAISLLQQK